MIFLFKQADDANRLGFTQIFCLEGSAVARRHLHDIVHKLRIATKFFNDRNLYFCKKNKKSFLSSNILILYGLQLHKN
jgi:hypothetical protein